MLHQSVHASLRANTRDYDVLERVKPLHQSIFLNFATWLLLHKSPLVGMVCLFDKLEVRF